MLDPRWGVDIILGGHSHTYLAEPAKVNNILIAQAGTGSDQIGRFDITVDDDTNSIVDYRWQTVKIDGKTAKPDDKLAEYIGSFKKEVDRKYNTMICRFLKTLTHPVRERETELGNLIADAFAQKSQCDVMLVGSGSIRVKELGPVVTLSDEMTCFPYDDTLTRYEISGSELKTIFSHIMRKSNRDGEGECYQVNRGVSALYDDHSGRLISLSVGNKSVSDTARYSVCLQNFHFNNSEKYLNISNNALLASGRTKVISTSARDVLDEYLRNNQNISADTGGRLIYKNGVKDSDHDCRE
jgi:5'-nucleotidase